MATTPSYSPPRSVHSHVGFMKSRAIPKRGADYQTLHNGSAPALIARAQNRGIENLSCYRVKFCCFVVLFRLHSPPLALHGGFRQRPGSRMKKKRETTLSLNLLELYSQFARPVKKRKYHPFISTRFLIWRLFCI